MAYKYDPQEVKNAYNAVAEDEDRAEKKPISIKIRQKGHSQRQ